MGEGGGDGACGKTVGKNKSGLMKTILSFLMIMFLLLGCTNAQKGKLVTNDKRIALRADTVNIVRLNDTLIIYENTCRGCAYQGSTHFSISDSLGIVKLLDIITTDNNPPEIDGGSISKDLVLVPLKTGVTKIRMYKFLNRPATAEDSLRYTRYTIQVNN